MAYIGKIPATGAFQKCDSLNASATADYTLQLSSTNVVPESVNHMIVSLNGVIQEPGATGGFTVSGSTLSFTSALTSSDTIDFVILLGNVLDIGTPSDDTVATAKIQDDAVTLAKMASGTDGNIISYDTSGNPVAVATGTDGQVLTSSGAGAVCAFEDAAGGANTPIFYAYIASNQTVSDATITKAQFDTEVYDSNSDFDSSTNYRWTPTVAGKYLITAQLNTQDGNGKNYDCNSYLYKNGSAILFNSNDLRLSAGYGYTSTMPIIAQVEANGSSDYFEIYGYVDGNGTVQFNGGVGQSWFQAMKIIE